MSESPPQIGRPIYTLATIKAKVKSRGCGMLITTRMCHAVTVIHVGNIRYVQAPAVHGQFNFSF